MNSHLRYAAGSAHIQGLLRDAAKCPAARRGQPRTHLARLFARLAAPNRLELRAAVVRPAPHH